MISVPAWPSTSERTVSAAITSSSPLCMALNYLTDCHACEFARAISSILINIITMTDWIDRATALATLGVRAQTLYAYVSRGRIGAQPDPADPRRSLYRAADVATLLSRRRRGRRP